MEYHQLPSEEAGFCKEEFIRREMLLKARKPSSLKVSFEEVMDMALKDINQDQVIPFGMGNAGGINYCFNDNWMADNYFNQKSFEKSVVNLF